MTILTAPLNPALDVCATVPLVEPDRKLHCTAAELVPGGGGINVARAIHRLGGQTTALFPCGGSTGDLLSDLLLGEGVPIVAVPIAGVTREDFSVDIGHEYRFVLPGPTLLASELGLCIEQVLRHADPGSYVVLSWLGPIRCRSVRARRDRPNSATAGARSSPTRPAQPSGGGAGRWLPSEAERQRAQRVRRPPTAHQRRRRRRGAIPARAGPNHATLVSLAADGALLVTDDGRFVTTRPPQVRVISAVGAGDSLVAGLVLALEEGCDVAEAARRGVATGTAAPIAVGHAPCQPRDVARLLPHVHASSTSAAGWHAARLTAPVLDDA